MTKAVKAKPARYADKSAGQPEMKELFVSLKKILSVYAKGNYIIKADKPGQYELYYGKEVEQHGRLYPELGFAALLIQKGYVGFYFFPVYVEDSLKKKWWPDLMKTLKGKTCFHIKKKDPVLLQQITDALKTGYEYYASMGWK